MLPEIAPLASLNPSTPIPVLVISETSPVGTPLPLVGATLPVTATDCPWVRLEVGFKIKVVVRGREMWHYVQF